MGLFFIYSLKVALCLTAFYLVYKLLLSRETFFGFNRAVLLGMVGVSLILPLVRFTVDNVPEAVGGFIVVEDLVAQAVAADAPGFSVTAVQTCFIIYIIGVAFFFGREVWSLLCLRRLMRGGRVAGVSRGVRTIVVQGDVSPFSWMGNIVISEKDYADNPRCILAHERAHIAGRHSWDILLCDLLIVFQWFNPAVWLLKAELQCVHEYEADRRVLSSGVNAADYQLLLIRKAVGDRLFSMANNLNQSSLKKRFTMMLKRKSNPWSRLRMAAMLPVAAVAVAAFATPEAESLSNEIKTESEAIAAAVANVAGTDTLRGEVGGVIVGTKNGKKVVAVEEKLDVEAAPKAVKDGGGGEVSGHATEAPQFPGGIEGLMKFLRDNIRYPEEAAKKGIKGRVVVQFIVDESGNVVEPTVEKSVDPLLDAEALRVVRSMPKWTPGKMDGKTVSGSYHLPVTFSVLDGAKAVSIGGEKIEGSPYVIVDGKHVDDMSGLKPDDIERIEVFKDKKETVDKYGEAAKNGVIVVTTKKK